MMTDGNLVPADQITGLSYLDSSGRLGRSTFPGPHAFLLHQVSSFPVFVYCKVLSYSNFCFYHVCVIYISISNPTKETLCKETLCKEH